MHSLTAISLDSYEWLMFLDYFAGKEDGSIFKAALLSGPPGVGKTTTATLVCKVKKLSCKIKLMGMK